MDLLAVIRVLWARRLAVAFGVVLAIAAALLAGHAMSGGANAGPGGVVSLRVMLDTADSQVVKAAPREVDTLSWRSALLADTLSSSRGREVLAASAGIPAQQLQVFGPSSRVEPPVETPLVVRTAAVSSVADKPYVVRAYADGIVPIISLEAEAPDVEGAGKLAGAAVDGLRSLLKAADASGSRGFVIDTVAPPVTDDIGGPGERRLPMLAAAVLVFGVWCGCILFWSGGAGRTRRIAGRARPA